VCVGEHAYLKWLLRILIKHKNTYNSVVSMFLAVPSMVEQYAEANLVII
jgi:hypothetical protein